MTKDMNNSIRWHLSILIGIFIMVLFITIGLMEPVSIPIFEIYYITIGRFLLVGLGTVAIFIYTYLFLRKLKVVEGLR
jgi:hypothetical protein